MQRCNWEWSIQQAQIFLQIEILNRLLNSCNVCVCERERERERESFLNKVWSSLIWFKATEFSKQERKLMIDQSKVKPYFARA